VRAIVAALVDGIIRASPLGVLKCSKRACYSSKGDLLVGLAVGVSVTPSWKIVKRPELLVCGACEVVVGLAISVLRKI
jgi:hypothetical protein